MTTQADLLREYLRRIYGPYNPVDYLFSQQRALKFDESTFRAAQTTRRAGKSYTAATILLHGAETEGSQNPYIALTRDSARRILWPTLMQIIERCHIECEPAESSLSIRFPNKKSEIFLIGADQKNFIDRLRGLKIKQAIVDEAQSFRDHIQQLVDDVLEPALVDLSGQLTLLGTPGLIPRGYFYDVTNENKGFSVHKWSILDNPHIPNAKEFIEEMLKRRGWTTMNPTYLREWMNQWVLDLDAMLFKFTNKNLYSELPEKESWNHVMGIDFGYNDKTAFCILAYSFESRHAYVVHSESKSEMIPSEIAARCQVLIDKYAPVSIVADTGGLGKSIAEEMRRRYAIPVKPAEKRDKAAHIALLNGDFIDCHLSVKANLEGLIYELTHIEKNEKGIEQEGFPSDECDAFIYAFFELKHYHFKEKQPVLNRNSEEYLEKQLEDEVRRMQNGESWWERLQ